MAELFTNEFVATVSRMRLSAGAVPRGGRHAKQVSAQMGAGMEFRDFRSYMPGDDIRRIDWNLYRRSNRLFLRLFEEERDLPVYTLLDCSDSMYFEDPPRANAARQAAAVIIGAALNQHDKPVLYPFGNTLQENFPAIQGMRSLPATLDRIAALKAAGTTNLRAVLDRLNARRLRKGLVVVVSDFFDPDGMEALTEKLHTLPHRLLLVQIRRETDSEPDLEGELSLVDCESGKDLRVTVTPESLKSYRDAYRDFQERLQSFVRKRQAGFIAIDADGDVLDQFTSLFAGGVINTEG